MSMSDRFIFLNNYSEMLDAKTNLIWSDIFIYIITYNRALLFSKQYSFETELNWRMPCVDELYELKDQEIITRDKFWSSSISLSNPRYVKGVSFFYKSMVYLAITDKCNLLLVRDNV